MNQVDFVFSFFIFVCFQILALLCVSLYLFFFSPLPIAYVEPLATFLSHVSSFFFSFLFACVIFFFAADSSCRTPVLQSPFFFSPFIFPVYLNTQTSCTSFFCFSSCFSSPPTPPPLLFAIHKAPVLFAFFLGCLPHIPLHSFFFFFFFFTVAFFDVVVVFFFFVVLFFFVVVVVVSAFFLVATTTHVCIWTLQNRERTKGERK